MIRTKPRPSNNLWSAAGDKFWACPIFMNCPYKFLLSAVTPGPKIAAMKFNKKKLYKARERKCLMCSRDFRSEWAGNRVCKKCRTSSAWKEGNMTSSDPVCSESVPAV